MKPTKLILILIVFTLFTSENVISQVLSPYIMGQNAWMPSFRYSGKFEVLAPKLQAAGIKMIRIGGNNYNNAVGTNSGLTNAQYDILIASVKGAGAEPIVQLSNLLTYQSAKDLVTYLNVTKNYNIKYWSIGNEPDIKNLTSAQVKTYITTIAPAIRDVSSNAIIFGPECAWMNGGIYGNMLDDLIGGSSSITGKDSSGRYYIDVVSYHSYDQYSITAIEDRIKALQTILTNANTTRTESPLTWAFTEFNTTTNNSGATLPADFKVWSMFAGQFMAEVYGLCMKYKALTLTCWATHEGGGARTGSDLGLFDAETSYTGRSNYYHTKMLGRFIKSNYMTSSSNISGVKVVSTSDATGYQVLILNYNSTQYDLTVRLNNGTFTQTNPLLIKLSTGSTDKELVSYVEAYGSRLLVFDINGNLTDDWRYSKTQADLRGEPIYVKSSIPGLSTQLGMDVVDASKFKVYPNPARFSAEFYIDYKLNKNSDLTIFDLTGKLLYSKKVTDEGILKMNDNSQFKPGMYIIKIGDQKTKLLIK